MSCCTSHSDLKDQKEENSSSGKLPKSFIGKYLYKLGEKETKRGAKKKKGCC